VFKSVNFVNQKKRIEVQITLTIRLRYNKGTKRYKINN